MNIPPEGLRWALTDPRYYNFLTDLAKQKGYDAFKVLDEGYTTYAPLSPNQIKSAIGNIGTYNPLDPRLAYAKGGIAKTNSNQG